MWVMECNVQKKWTTKRSGTKIKGGYEANFMFINTVIPSAIYSVLIENYLKMPLILVDLSTYRTCPRD